MALFQKLQNVNVFEKQNLPHITSISIFNMDYIVVHLTSPRQLNVT